MQQCFDFYQLTLDSMDIARYSQKFNIMFLWRPSFFDTNWENSQHCIIAIKKQKWPLKTNTYNILIKLKPTFTYRVTAADLSPPGTDHIFKSPGNRRFVDIPTGIVDFSEFTRKSVFMSFEDNNLLFSTYLWRF